MAMTPENYANLESKCKELCNKCKKIIDSRNPDDIYIQEEAAQVYDEIIGLKRELEIAIRNIKTPSIQKSYNSYLEEVKSYKDKIRFIAHIM